MTYFTHHGVEEIGYLSEGIQNLKVLKYFHDKGTPLNVTSWCTMPYNLDNPSEEILHEALITLTTGSIEFLRYSDMKTHKENFDLFNNDMESCEVDSIMKLSANVIDQAFLHCTDEQLKYFANYPGIDETMAEVSLRFNRETQTLDVGYEFLMSTLSFIQYIERMFDALDRFSLNMAKKEGVNSKCLSA